MADKKETSLRSSYAATKKKYGADSPEALKARGKLNDFLESIGRRVNRVKGEPINGVVNESGRGPVTAQPNPGPNNTQSSGVQPSVEGSGNPLAEPTSKDTKNLFGKFSKEATASGNIYQDIMPLNQLDPALSAQQQQALSGLQYAQQQSMLRDPRQEQMLDMFLRNAQQGMSQPELTGLREEGIQGINNTLADTLRQLSLRNAGSGVSGPAGTIGQNAAGLNALQARRDLERDVLQKNLDFRQQNLQQGFNAANAASNSYFNNMSQAGQNFWTGSSQGAQQVLDSQKWNADQSTNYAAGKLGALVGGGDWAAQQYFAEEANDIARKGIEAAKGTAIGGGGGGGSGQAAGYQGSSLGQGYKSMTKTAGQAQQY